MEKRGCEVIVTTYDPDDHFGKYRIGDLADVDLTPFAPLLGGEVIAPESLLFLDTETTGLAGGSGTVAFLIGVGYFVVDRLIVKQFFMRDYDEEEQMLTELSADLRTRDALVTYNGKAFDMNLLSSRYTMNAIRMPREGCHLDLLYPARRVWRRQLVNCRLMTIESSILGHSREDDVPGNLIPEMYFDYLRTGNRASLDIVMEHNRMDIVAMTAMLKYLSDATTRDFPAVNAAELLGLAGFYCSVGDAGRAERLLERCLAAVPSPYVARDALMCIAAIKKRNKELKTAAMYWERLAMCTPSVGVYPFIELSKYYEHTVGDFFRAKEYADKARLVAEGVIYRGSRLREEIATRLARIGRKIERELGY